jgi:uncharacterized membrane protein
MTFVLAFLIGAFAGLRSMMAPAVVAWAIHLGQLKVDWPLAFLGHAVSVAIFSFAAIGELIADKLPRTPARTAAIGLSARIVTGGLTGACIAVAGGVQPVVGAILGAIGGVVGAFVGYQARTRLAKIVGRDLIVAIAEDMIAIGGCVGVVTLIASV